MEHEAADADEEVPEVGDAEDCVVAVSAAGADADVGEVEE